METTTHTAHTVGGTSPTPYEEAREQKARMIRKMFFFGYEMQWHAPRTAAEKYMTKQRLCENRLNDWCKGKYSCVRKTMKAMTVEELVKVLSQLEQVYKSFMDEYKKAG